MIKEIDCFGVYLPPFLGYLAAAALLWAPIRWMLQKLHVHQAVWHVPLFNTALFVILVAGLEILVH